MGCSTVLFTLMSFAVLLTVVQARILTKQRSNYKFLNEFDRNIYKNCDDARRSGYRQYGVYQLHFKGNKSDPFQMLCNHTDTVSQAIIQRRMYGNVTFNRTWYQYQNPFGDVYGDWWAGLENIYKLSTSGRYFLTIYLTDWQHHNHQISYTTFQLNSNSDRYRLFLGAPYHGDLVDDFSFNNHMQFGTQDHPDVYSCAYYERAGWWFNSQNCSLTMLNGKHYAGKYFPPHGVYDGIYWRDWEGRSDKGYSLLSASMVLTQY